jgi:hypothetical protein
LELRSELWMMRSDGREWKKLTNFNRRGSVESRLVNGLRTFIGTSAWHPDGNKLAFVVYYDVPGPGVGYESCVFVGDLIEGISVDGR